MLAIVASGELQLISRNGHDRTALFRTPFYKLATAGLPAMVADSEIAVPDDRGVTHIDGLTQAMRLRKPERPPISAFDLLHLDGHDLRPCVIEDRKALLRDVIRSAECERIVCVDQITSGGAALFEAVRQIGAEGIVSKRSGSAYCGGAVRDWLKTKVSEIAAFVITGYIEREAVAVAELKDGMLVPVGLVKLGLGGKGLWRHLARCAPTRRRNPALSRCSPELVAEIKFFGRYRSGFVRHGVLLTVS